MRDKEIEKNILGRLYNFFVEQIEKKKPVHLSILDLSHFSVNTEKLLFDLSSMIDRLDFFRILKNLEKDRLIIKTQEEFDYRQYIYMTLGGLIKFEQKFKDISKDFQELLLKILKIIAEKEKEDDKLFTPHGSFPLI